MATPLEVLFRNLTSFSPTRMTARDADWETFVEWVIAQGLAPLVAYNLEYRTAGAGAPQWARDRLLSIYQGSANDNVMKLVNFKRAVDELEGRKVLLIGGASYTDSLYPHVAWRPVMEVRLLVPPKDVDPMVAWLRRAEFAPDQTAAGSPTERVLSDTRTSLIVHGALLRDPSFDQGLFDRSLAYKVYGPSMRRLSLEDADGEPIALPVECVPPHARRWADGLAQTFPHITVTPTR